MLMATYGVLNTQIYFKLGNLRYPMCPVCNISILNFKMLRVFLFHLRFFFLDMLNSVILHYGGTGKLNANCW